MSCHSFFSPFPHVGNPICQPFIFFFIYLLLEGSRELMSLRLFLVPFIWSFHFLLSFVIALLLQIWVIEESVVVQSGCCLRRRQFYKFTYNWEVINSTWIFFAVHNSIPESLLCSQFVFFFYFLLLFLSMSIFELGVLEIRCWLLPCQTPLDPFFWRFLLCSDIVSRRVEHFEFFFSTFCCQCIHNYGGYI